MQRYKSPPSSSRLCSGDQKLVHIFLTRRKWSEACKPALYSPQGPGGCKGVFLTSPLKFSGLTEGMQPCPPWVSAVECAQAVWSTLNASTVPLHMPYVPCLLLPWLSLTPVAISWTFCSDNGWSPPGLHFDIFGENIFLHAARALRGSCGLQLLVHGWSLLPNLRPRLWTWNWCEQMECLWLAREMGQSPPGQARWCRLRKKEPLLT